MNVTIEGVKVAGTPEGPVPVVLLAPADGPDAGGAGVDTPDGPGGPSNLDDAGGPGGDTGGPGGGAVGGGEPADGTDAVLPIFIGFDEAVAIARGVDAVDIGRPLTHDLLLDVMEALGGRVERVVVRAVEDNTYFADLELVTPRGEETVDARPSDSLALAARTNAPIDVEEEVFAEGRRDRGEFDGLEDIREAAEL
jgi:bifunctional DNase/RNase